MVSHQNETSNARMIADYIAGMTDNYALKCHDAFLKWMSGLMNIFSEYRGHVIEALQALSGEGIAAGLDCRVSVEPAKRRMVT